MTTLTAWAASVEGRYLDVDGVAGPQCWDAVQAYMTTFGLGTLWTVPGATRYQGYAAGSVEGYGVNGLEKVFDLIPGTQPGQPGDVVVWAYGQPGYPTSHNGVLLEDRGTVLRVVSQNSSPVEPSAPGYNPDAVRAYGTTGPTRVQNLPRGECWFLRPKTTTTPTGKDTAMSGYELITKYTSPNQSPRTLPQWGSDGVIRGITDHWWGLPEWGQTFEGVIAELCRRGNGDKSAHYVVSDTRVAYIVDESQGSWHAGSARGNAETIGIEIDPTLRGRTLQTVIELSADIERRRGSMFYYGHRDWANTQCPGDQLYNLIGSTIVPGVNKLLAGGKSAVPAAPAAARTYQYKVSPRGGSLRSATIRMRSGDIELMLPPSSLITVDAWKWGVNPAGKWGGREANNRWYRSIAYPSWWVNASNLVGGNDPHGLPEVK